MGALEPWHLIVVLVIVLVLFGAGRLGEIGGAMGRGVREFKSAQRDDDPIVTTPPPVNAAATSTVADVICPSCSTRNAGAQTFCTQCGTRLTKAA